jgi:hypothetical protein
MNALVLTSTLLLTAAVCMPAFTADTTKRSEPLIPLPGVIRIERGMHRDTVRVTFGAPSTMLSADVWVYFDVKPINPFGVNVNGGRPENCDCMLVKFVKDRADVVQFCESGPVRDFILEQEKAKAAGRRGSGKRTGRTRAKWIPSIMAFLGRDPRPAGWHT